MSKDDIWKRVGNSSGLLTDEDIMLLGKNNLLITSRFAPSQVKQTCYELRVGEVAYFLSRPDVERKKRVDEKNPVIIRPQEVVTIITFEEVELTDFIVGRIISKGHLFSIGLSPVITFVDPGFSGNLGITFINLSKRAVRLNHKDTICKIEFEKLGKSVKEPYRGPHAYASELWPIDMSKLLPRRKIDAKELKNEEFLRREAKYFGEPFDLFSERIIHMESQIRTLRFVATSIITLFLGIGVYSLAQRVLDMIKILPETIQSGIVAGVIGGLFTILAVMLEYYFIKRKK